MSSYFTLEVCHFFIEAAIDQMPMSFPRALSARQHCPMKRPLGDDDDSP